MKIWVVELGDYGEIDFQQYCSSEEIANAVADHHHEQYKASNGSYFNRGDYDVQPIELDEYYKKYLSKLQRALK